jgi:hypothetical protein
VSPDPIAIRLEAESAAEVRAAVRTGLLEFNFTFVPATEFIPLVFAARDPAAIWWAGWQAKSCRGGNGSLFHCCGSRRRTGASKSARD